MLLAIPDPPPVDPLDVFVALESRLFGHRADKDRNQQDAGVRLYFVPLVIDANRDTMPGLFRFAQQTNTGHLLDEHVAALFVSVRLFGDDWPAFAPPIRNKYWAQSIEEFRQRNAAGPCAA